MINPIDNPSLTDGSSQEPSLQEKLSWRLRGLTNHVPRSADAGLADGPLVVAGMFQTGSGLGRSATMCYEGLKSAGYDPVAVCVSSLLGQVDAPATVPLGTMPADRAGTLILHVNAPETEVVLHRLGLHRMKRWSVIGYWAWELPRVPLSWLSVSRLLTKIWVPSTFVKDAMGTQLACQVDVVPHRVSVPRDLPASADQMGDPAVKCLVMADSRSSLARKNVSAAIAMFRDAFSDRPDARLTLKVRNLNEFTTSANQIRAFAAEDSRCELIDETLERDHVWNLVSRNDIILSCHRSEGFGLHLAEGMALGRCVVATGWSGNTDFMTSRNSMLLPYKMTPVEDPDKIYPGGTTSHWADVNIGAGATKLRSLADSPELRKSIAFQARSDIQKLLSGKHYFDALNAIGIA